MKPRKRKLGSFPVKIWIEKEKSRCAKQDGESSPEKLSKRPNSQNHKKKLLNPTGTPRVSLRDAGEGAVPVGCWRGWFGDDSGKDTKPTGTEGVERVVWSHGREGYWLGESC
jgi:hypothetical protein